MPRPDAYSEKKQQRSITTTASGAFIRRLDEHVEFAAGQIRYQRAVGSLDGYPENTLRDAESGRLTCCDVMEE